VKIRHFGLLSAGNVNAKLATARAALLRPRDQRKSSEPPSAPSLPITKPDWRTLFHRLTGIDLGVCPDCGGAVTPAPLLEGACEARAPPGNLPDE
jgi:hypothetical protein